MVDVRCCGLNALEVRSAEGRAPAVAIARVVVLRNLAFRHAAFKQPTGRPTMAAFMVVMRRRKWSGGIEETLTRG